MKKACKTIIFLPTFLKFGNSFLCDLATKIVTLLDAKVKGKTNFYCLTEFRKPTFWPHSIHK